ncbi:MAG TPA: hypothetical protein VNI02_02695 [Blastocatellia bacterium]|jgi:hypothetical protein|nr:hypothetical protein [Blastocatellia bacterium]
MSYGSRPGRFLFTSLLLPAILFCLAGEALPQAPQISDADRARIAEAFHLAGKLGDEVWEGWSKSPFALLLVTPDYEFLMRHPSPPKEFTESGYDSTLKSKIYYRKRAFNAEFLATMYVGGVPTIVVGQAENTGAKTSTRWVVTLLHEHFHQYQYSQPDYQAGVKALDLARGDETGMWMLNYPFPYSDAEVNKRFSVMVEALAAALESAKTAQFSGKLSAYVRARKQFEQALSPDDYRYFSFQLWQEGIARYTEYRMARLAAGRYEPTKEFMRMKDFSSFGQEAAATLDRILSGLPKLSLDKDRRVAFYTVGAAEALLLDEANPDWQRHYLAQKFYPEKYFVK